MNDAFSGVSPLDTNSRIVVVFFGIAAESYLKIYLRSIIHECQLRNVFHMSVSGRLYYVTTAGWCQLSKYCMLFTLKDVACIPTYAPGSAAYQTIRELCLLRGSSSPPPRSCVTFWNTRKAGILLGAGAWALAPSHVGHTLL